DHGGGEVAIFGEGRRDAEAAVDVAASPGHRESLLGPQHQIGRVLSTRGRELARRREIAWVAFGRARGDPAGERGDLGVRHPALAGQIAAAGDRPPGGHAALLDRFEDLVAPLVEVLVLAEGERGAAAGAVTFLAVLLQQGHHVLAERPLVRARRITSPICLAFAQKFLPEHAWVPFFNLASFVIGTYINTVTKKERLS